MQATPAPFGRKSVDLGPAIQPQIPSPAPPLQSYSTPTPRINNEDDLNTALQSPSIQEFLSFIRALDEAVRGVKLSSSSSETPPVAALVSCLDTLSSWVDETPPAPHSLRYGNPAYRTWFSRLEEEGKGLVEGVLSHANVASEAATAIVPYFLGGFGNSRRIDYGTGHETNFVAFLFCLAKLGVVKEADCVVLVVRVFHRYLVLMRKVQTTYWLEPAGSHGVWGLEDYQFLPFLWGSSQLIDHPLIKPKSIHNEDILEGMAQDYMYLECIKFIKQVKKGPLWETSPYLCDISAVPNWSKVNSGLLKMYQAEVLGKLPIMQHFLFGSLIPFPDG